MKIARHASLVVLLAAVGVVPLAAAQATDAKTVPMIPVLTPQEAKQAKPAQPERAAPVYDEDAVGADQIAAALAKAKKENRRVYIQWGANWCGWCVQLHDHLREDSSLRRKMLYEYDIVHIDIGKWDKHLDLAEQYGADFKSHGVPYLTILDADGNVLANQETGTLEAPDDPAHSHDTDKLMGFLTEHQAEYVSATAVLDDALAQAKAEGKLAFVHYGAPWCPWCHKLDAFLARDDVKAILDDQFVDVKIDTDRMIGGGEMLGEMRKSQQGGIPWFAFLDGDGKIVAHSSESGQNIGYPAMEEEAAAFLDMLRKTRPDITKKQLKFLKTELVNSVKR
jgi:thiol-disulfide isomerase/thioredoxin